MPADCELPTILRVEWRREREVEKEEGKGGGEIRAEPLIPPIMGGREVQDGGLGGHQLEGGGK